MIINSIVLVLGETSSGHEDPDPRAIRRRVIEAIHNATNNSYREVGLLPTPAVADLLLKIWAHRDRG
jgi:hypothetical protein